MTTYLGDVIVKVATQEINVKYVSLHVQKIIMNVIKANSYFFFRYFKLVRVCSLIGRYFYNV